MIKGVLISSMALATGLAAPAHAQSADQAPDDNRAAIHKESKRADIVVKGIRRSLASAQALKENSDSIVDSIVAEDIDKLPDVTVAESIANITGAQVERAEGEAQNVRLRGLSDVATTYNGLEVFTGKGRGVALQDFPAGSIRRLDVYKSATADLVEPGIGGLVNVRAQRPFDFRKDQFFGKISGDHWYQSQGLGYDASLLISKRFHTSIGELGFLVSGSYTQIKYVDGGRVNNTAIIHRTNLKNLGLDAADYPDGIYYPSSVNTNYNAADRWRPSATAVLQWRPSNSLEFHIDGLFQGYRSKGRNSQFKANAGAGATISNVELFPDSDQVKSMDMTAGALPAGSVQSITGKTDTYMVDGGFDWHRDKLKISGVAAYNHSRFESRNFLLNFALRNVPTMHFDYDTDVGVGGGSVVISNYDLTNPDNYRLVNITDGGQVASGKEVQGRLDAEYDVGGVLDRLQVGVMYTNRHAASYAHPASAYTGTAPAGTYYTALPLDYIMTGSNRRNDASDSLRRFLVPTRDSILDKQDYLRDLVGLGDFSYGDPTYRSVEDTYSGYAQARYRVNLGLPIDGMLGLRVVHTEDDVTAPSLTEAENNRNSYTDFLPNVSARVHLDNHLQARFAFTMTRTRPSFDNLNPVITYGAMGNCNLDLDTVVTCTSASGGNINLKPTRSKNYDFSLEYYPARTTSVTVGLFRKDLKGFISNVTEIITDPDLGYVSLTQPQNAGAGRIQGVEAAASTFFSAAWLPQWMHRFGAQANVTYLDNGSELPQSQETLLPGQQPIAGVSRWLYNLGAFYDTKAVSIRLAYNHRSKYISEYDTILNNSVIAPLKQSALGWLSLSASINPTQNVSLMFTATNLLGAHQQNIRPYDAAGDSYIYQTNFFESTYRLGVRFRF